MNGQPTPDSYGFIPVIETASEGWKGAHAANPQSDGIALEESAPAPRILIKDTGAPAAPGSDKPITDAERERAATALYLWQGKPLEPYSLAREGLFNICRGFLPMGTTPLPEEYSAQYLLEAILLLFICASDATTLRGIRHSADLVIDASQDWANEHIPRGQQHAAGALAFEILRDATLTIAVPRPEGSSTRAEGNSHRP